MTEDPAVDIVILSWNRAEETLAAVRSALAQRRVRPNVVLVDQGSRPEEWAKLRDGLRDAGRVHVVRLDTNIGVPGGRNLGAEQGTADTLVFLDNDAEFDGPAVCRGVVDHFAAEPRTGILGFQVLVHATRELDLSSWNHAQPPNLWAGRSFWSTRFAGGACAIRRSVFRQTGGYDPALTFMEEEKDLGYRAVQAGWRIRHAPDLRILHKISPGNRVAWSHGRTYYLARNIVYCEHKYGASARQLLDATRNALRIARKKGFLMDGAKGALAGHWMGLSTRMRDKAKVTPLSDNALEYIRRHELRFYEAPFAD